MKTETQIKKSLVCLSNSSESLLPPISPSPKSQNNIKRSLSEIEDISRISVLKKRSVSFGSVVSDNPLDVVYGNEDPVKKLEILLEQEDKINEEALLDTINKLYQSIDLNSENYNSEKDIALCSLRQLHKKEIDADLKKKIYTSLIECSGIEKEDVKNEVGDCVTLLCKSMKENGTFKVNGVNGFIILTHTNKLSAIKKYIRMGLDVTVYDDIFKSTPVDYAKYEDKPEIQAIFEKTGATLSEEN